MKKIRRWSGLAVVWLAAWLALGACGERTLTSSPVTAGQAVVSPGRPAVSNTALPIVTGSTTNPPEKADISPITQPTPNTTNPAGNSAPTITTGPAAPAQPLNIPWVKEGVCYEVFVRSFFDSNGDGNGDLNGLISRLDYINDGNPNSTKSLGANCIWLMPITQSPSYHGYDTTDYYTVNKDYGSNDDLKRLIQEAHKRGIKVLSDLVLNHTSNQHPWFQQALADPKSPYRDYYIFRADNPGYDNLNGGKAFYKNPQGNDYYFAQFGGDLPDLNYRNPAVTAEMEKVVRFWLQDIGVDGFRLDAVRYLIEDGQNQADTPETKAWLRDFRKFYTSIKPDAFTIGEVYSNLPLDGYYPDQLDEFFAFSLADLLVKSGANGTSSFVDAAKDINNRLPFQRFGVFLTNHDQNRILDQPGISLPKMQTLAAAYLTLPGLPFIYYGEEIGMLGRKPDEKIRTPMQWSPDPNGGFTTGTPWEALNTGIQKFNVQVEDSDPESLLNLYRKLVHLRRNTPALSGGSYLPLDTTNFVVGAYLRHAANSDVLMVFNMDNSDAKGIKLSVAKSDLAEGDYKPGPLLVVNNPNPAIAPLKVGPGGSISGYIPLPTIPANSAYILELKK